jgi:hypothetical protein
VKEAGGGISADGEHGLSNIRTFPSIPNAEIAPSLRELDHYRLLRNIHDGDVPIISVPGLLTQKGESPYWRGHVDRAVRLARQCRRSLLRVSNVIQLRARRCIFISCRPAMPWGYRLSYSGDHMSNGAKKSVCEPLLLRWRSRAIRDSDRPTLDEMMPFAVHREKVLQAVTKDTRVRNETTDDD